jgi:hypothetical protein
MGKLASIMPYWWNETMISEFLKFVGPIGPWGQKIMRSANNVGNAGPHVRQTFLNDVFTFLTEVGGGFSLEKIILRITIFLFS